MKQLLAEPAQGQVTASQRLLAAAGAERCCHSDVARRASPALSVGQDGILLRSWGLLRQQKQDKRSASVRSPCMLLWAEGRELRVADNIALLMCAAPPDSDAKYLVVCTAKKRVRAEKRARGEPVRKVILVHLNERVIQSEVCTENLHQHDVVHR